MKIEALVSSYSPSPETLGIVRATKLLLIAGVVGGGKNTVVNELTKNPEYHMLISHTTRAPRENHGIMEENEVDYYFVTPERVESMLKNNEFVEAKYVHGNVYGTSVSEVAEAQAAGKIALTDIDIQGVQEYLDIKPETHAIFLLPPSVETWLKRLERRYGDLEQHQDELKKRFKTARDEINHIKADDRFVIVINDDLSTTVERIESILREETDRTSDYADAVTEHLLDFLETRI